MSIATNDKLNVFNRLFKESSIKRARRIRNEYQRPAHCSFRPSITKRARKLVSPCSRQETFDKLYKQDKVIREKRELQIKRAQTALPKGCSFKPEINKLSRKYGRNSDNYTIAIHDRLYSHAVKHLRAVDLKHRNRRHIQCTFRPSTISYGYRSARSNQNEEKPAHERLYQSAKVRRRRREKMNKNRAFLCQEHTFSPRINTTQKMSKGSDLRVPEFTGTLGNETSSPESLVFDRLHEQAVQHQQRRLKLAARRPNYPFSPTISRRGRRLIKKVEREINVNRDVNENNIDQSVVSNADRSMTISERLFEQAKVSQQKKRAIAQQNERSKPKDCTFTPRINRNANRKKCSRNRAGKKRIGDRLYSDFLSRKNRREERIKERDRAYKTYKRRKIRRLRNQGGDSDSDSDEFATISPSKFEESYKSKMKRYLESKEKRKRKANSNPIDCTFTPIINRHVKTKSIVRSIKRNIKRKNKSCGASRRKGNAAIMQTYNAGLMIKPKGYQNRFETGKSEAIEQWTEKDIEDELNMFKAKVVEEGSTKN